MGLGFVGLLRRLRKLRRLRSLAACGLVGLMTCKHIASMSDDFDAKKRRPKNPCADFILFYEKIFLREAREGWQQISFCLSFKDFKTL